MNIIIVDKKEAKITTTTNHCIINSQKIPFHLIDVIIIEGKTILQTQDIHRLSKNQIAILLLNSTHYLSTIIHPAQSKNAQLKLSQYQAALKPLPIAQFILEQKITNHIKELKKHNITLNKSRYIKQIQNAKTLDELLGIEGNFSKLYFSHYFNLFPKNLHKNKRSKRPPKDPLNAILSWYYTLFYNLITIKLLSHGFEPQIGYLHRPFREHNALSSDILETIRAQINQFTYQIFQNSLSQEDFTKKDEAVFLRWQSRKKAYILFQELQKELTPQITNTISQIRSML